MIAGSVAKSKEKVVPTYESESINGHAMFNLAWRDPGGQQRETRRTNGCLASLITRLMSCCCIVSLSSARVDIYSVAERNFDSLAAIDNANVDITGTARLTSDRPLGNLSRLPSDSRINSRAEEFESDFDFVANTIRDITGLRRASSDPKIVGIDEALRKYLP